MAAARAIPQRQGDSSRVTYGAPQLVNDDGLVAVAKMGNGTAFEELHKRHAEKMFRVARQITRCREDAEDAVQECFLSAYVHLKHFDGRARFSTWLSRIAINAALMKVRKNRISREVSLEETAETVELRPDHKPGDSSPNPEEICAKRERDAVLRESIARLRPKLRETVALYQLQEFSMHETAKALGISVAAAKARLFHARAALRRTKELQVAAE
jgi:RNA polymerase sigma factor (sigma-70 family)